MNEYQFKKILIIKHGSLGDIISATSVIVATRQKYKNTKIDILTSSSYSSFFKKMNKSFTIYEDNREGILKSFKLLFFLNKKKYDLIIDLQNSTRTKYYAYFLKAFSKVKINSTHQNANFKYSYNKYDPPSVIDGLVSQVKLINIEALSSPVLEFLKTDC